MITITPDDIYFLHCQGFTFKIQDGTLFVSPAHKLTDDRKAYIKRNKQQIIGLLKGLIDEGTAKNWLEDATHRISRFWSPGALLATKGTPLYSEYQKTSDALDKAFFGTREQFLKALRSYEVVMMKIADNYRQGK